METSTNKKQSLLQIADLLASQTFSDNCESIANDESLLRQVGWCYYLSAAELSSFDIHGRDLIFVSSNAFFDHGSDYRLIKRLISVNAAGLCLVNDFQYHDFSSPALSLAMENDFPLIIMNGNIQPEKIVQQINEKILVSRGTDGEIAEGTNYYRQLLKMNEGSKIRDIVYFTANYLNLDVVYWHLYSEPLSTAEFDVREVLNPEKRTEIDTLGVEEPYFWDHYAAMPIHILRDPHAYVMFSKKTQFSRFELIILQKLTVFLRDRVVNSFIRRLQFQHGSQSEWIHRWLQGNIDDSELRLQMKKLGIKENCSFLAVCVRIPRTKETYSYSYRKS